MILIENCRVYGWEEAIRGMRNPKNSWERSDSYPLVDGGYFVGDRDLELAQKLADAGQVHGKFLRMISVYMDITAPRYWWIEFDTYKVGTVSNSCSTMHKIQEKGFELSDFSHDYLDTYTLSILKKTIQTLNENRRVFNNWEEYKDKFPGYDRKQFWYQMIQLLPQSYNQKRTVMLNYAVLKNMYEYRKNHKLNEWVCFCEYLKKLPHSELITGEY